jgi:Tol biopolymer transport system component
MKRWIPTAAALLVAAMLAVPAVRHWRERPPLPPAPPQPLRSAWLPPEGTVTGSGGEYPFGLALATNGRQLVYPAAKAGLVSLWLHDLRNGETRALPGTDDAVLPFWSAEGSRIGFFAHHKLRILDLASGQAADIADASDPRGGAFNTNGDVIFAPSADSGLMRRDPNGAIAPLTALDSGETFHAWPAFVGDTHVIFLVAGSSRPAIWIAPLDKPAERRKLIDADAQAIVTGHTILYLRDLALVSQAIDPQTFEGSGRSTVAGSNVGRGPLGQLFATASADVLIYGAPGTTLRQLRWVSRDGSPVGSPGEPVDAWDVRIAPDDTRRVLVTEMDRQLRTLDVFIRTAMQPAPLRLSLSTDVDESGVWSPDGLRIAWTGQRRKVMIRGAGAVLPEQTIAAFDTPVQVWDWSRDGRSLLIGRRNAETGDDLWIQPPAEGTTARPYAVAPFNQAFGVFSPDGRSIAYASDESGQFDIYIDSYPTPGHRARVTTSGGTEPRWSADGRELFFRRGSEIHALTLEGSAVRSTTKLFDAGAAIRAYDVSRDGRFLLNLPGENHMPIAATIVSHWSAFAQTLRREEQ